MDKNKTEISFNTPNARKKQHKGLQDYGTKQLICINCKNPLLILQLVTSENSQCVRVSARCGICGSYSQVEQIYNNFFPGAPNDDVNFDVINENEFMDDPNAPECDVMFKVWRK